MSNINISMIKMWQKQIAFFSSIGKLNFRMSSKKQIPFDLNLNQNNIDPANQLVIKYVEGKQKQISISIHNDEPKVRVSVPKLFDPQYKSETWMNKIDKQWNKMALVFDIDYSFLIGRKRAMMKSYYQKNIDKESTPFLFSKINPEYFLEIQQVKFEPDFFIQTDPEIMKIQEEDELDQAAEQQKIIDLYETQPTRFGSRLAKEFNVPSSYHRIIEYALACENRVYFCGVNSYVMRNFLASCFTLSQIKGIFYECLNYSLMRSKDVQDLQKNAKEIIYARHYNLLQKFQNGCILQSLALINGDYVFFGRNFTTQSLTDSYEYISKVNKSTKDTADAQKVQKHAILQILLGNLWEQPFTKNKFPYLSENFHQLTADDQKALEELYHTNYVKYKGAAKIFFDKNKK